MLRWRIGGQKVGVEAVEAAPLEHRRQHGGTAAARLPVLNRVRFTGAGVIQVNRMSRNLLNCIYVELLPVPLFGRH